MTFTIAVLETEESALKTHGGVTNSLVMDQKNSVGMPVVTQVTPGATLSNVALFIDTTKAALTPLAQEKDWWCAPACLPVRMCAVLGCESPSRGLQAGCMLPTERCVCLVSVVMPCGCAPGSLC